MQRFLLSICLGILFFSLSYQSAEAKDIKYVVENKHFTKYNKPLPGSNKDIIKGEVEVIYFFWYGSSEVAKVDRQLRQWAKSRSYNLKFSSYPVSFDKDFGAFSARVFFALSYLKKEEALSPLLIEAISKQQVDLKNPSSVSKWMESHGVNKEQFQMAINHSEVKSFANLVPKMNEIYEIKSVPTIVIDGQYQIRAHKDLNSGEWLETVKFMVDKLSEGQARP